MNDLPPPESPPSPEGAPPRMRPSASLAFVYFGIAFTLSVAPLMVLVSLARPLLSADAPSALRLGLMLLPPALGVLYGVRVARVGLRSGATLGEAMRRGLRDRP